MASASCLGFVVLVAMASAASAQLSSTFYDTSCPNALATIKAGVAAAVKNEARMGASLVRLHFHDCFVDGCDGSVLLADTGSFVGEQGAAPNNNSIRGMNVIDNIKTQVEAVSGPALGGGRGGGRPGPPKSRGPPGGMYVGQAYGPYERTRPVRQPDLSIPGSQRGSDRVDRLVQQRAISGDFPFR